ncbi:MAG: DUF559 domain-containing protein [Bacteroidota bacterium]|nr:DUF559 domain-containing protein [Bacteroidota bacterium]
MDQSHYNKRLKALAQKLRRESTLGEIVLWNNALKNRKMYGLQFLRQYSIDNYIVDFVCRSVKLIIEVDGYSHNFKHDADILRDQYFNNLGYTVLRFTENEVNTVIQNVIRSIEHYVLNIQNNSIPPAPFSKGEKRDT